MGGGLRGASTFSGKTSKIQVEASQNKAHFLDFLKNNNFNGKETAKSSAAPSKCWLSQTKKDDVH